MIILLSAGKNCIAHYALTEGEGERRTAGSREERRENLFCLCLVVLCVLSGLQRKSRPLPTENTKTIIVVIILPAVPPNFLANCQLLPPDSPRPLSHLKTSLKAESLSLEERRELSSPAAISGSFVFHPPLPLNGR